VGRESGIVAGMRFSIWPVASQPFADVVEVARHAEQTGWDGVYFADHFMANAGSPTPVETPTLECGTTIAALCALVPRVRIGSLVFGNTYRHPAVLANMAATTDQIAGGRFTLGVGAGWQENEHRQYGIPLPPVGERLDRFEEALQVLHGLLRQPRTTFEGRHYQLTDAICEPKPVQQPLPILIGGSGERRMLGIVARYADVWNTWGRPDLIAHKSAVLDRFCAEVGRDPAEIARSAQVMILLNREAPDSAGGLPMIGVTPEQLVDLVAQYAEAGLDEFIVPDRTLGRGSERLKLMDLLLEKVFAQFR
jgi:F420-dependent oxidoreductase-like protein